MVTEKEIIDYCKGKSILLVGNCDSIVMRDNSGIIDSFNVVVRMNHATPQKNIGDKTDIWLCSYNNTNLQPVEYSKFKPKYVMRLNEDFDKMHPSIDWYSWPRSEHKKFKDELGSLPTTGVMAIYWFVNKIKQPINIIGFDNFDTGTFYNKDKKLAWKYHNPENEKEFTQKYILEGKVFSYAC